MYCFHESLPDSLPPPVAFSPPMNTLIITLHVTLLSTINTHHSTKLNYIFTTEY